MLLDARQGTGRDALHAGSVSRAPRSAPGPSRRHQSAPRCARARAQSRSGGGRRGRRCAARAEAGNGASNGNGARRERPLNVMIAGPPAAGKGTQCERIVEKFGLVHVSAGDLLRAEVALESPEGQLAASFMNQGKLVPNEVVVQMVEKRLAAADAQARGWLLDGYPRSAEQAEAIEAAGIHPDVFILIKVPDEELVERVTGRRSDPHTGAIYHLKFNPPPPDVPHERLVQRADDTHDKLRTRLDTYHSSTMAVLGYYQKELVEVDGSRPMDEVFASIDQVVSAAVAGAAAEAPVLQAA